MFVGGPNTRTDFHIEQGSEFFYQLKGNMELPTIQAGKRKLVKINEGEVSFNPRDPRGGLVTAVGGVPAPIQNSTFSPKTCGRIARFGDRATA